MYTKSSRCVALRHNMLSVASAVSRNPYDCTYLLSRRSLGGALCSNSRPQGPCGMQKHEDSSAWGAVTCCQGIRVYPTLQSERSRNHLNCSFFNVCKCIWYMHIFIFTKLYVFSAKCGRPHTYYLYRICNRSIYVKKARTASYD